MKHLTILAAALLAAPAFAQSDRGTQGDTRTTEQGRASDAKTKADGTQDTGNVRSTQSDTRAGEHGTVEQGRAADAKTRVDGTRAGEMDDDAVKVKLSEPQLMTQIHKVNELEIDAGKLAQKNGKDRAVKDYGKMLERDHSKADQEIRDLAKKMSVDLDKQTLPAAVTRKNDATKAKAEALKNLKDAEFDRNFAQLMARGHDHTIKMLRDARADVKSPELGQWIDKTLPVLEHHREVARDLAKGGTTSAIDAADRGRTQGRTPESSMHRSADESKDRTDSRTAPMDTSKDNAPASGSTPSGSDQKR